MDKNGKQPYLGKKILVILAHPDDETFGMGGTLGKYAALGAEIEYVCVTRGEAGEVSPQFLEGYGSAGARREQELLDAAAVLGISQVHFLGYRDSGMPGSEANAHSNALTNQPVETVAAKLVEHIRRFRPDIILTHDPVGGYHHQDHIHVHLAALKAWDFAANPAFSESDLPPFQPEFLYYSIFPRNFVRFATSLLRFFGQDPSKFGRNGDIDLQSLADDPVYPPHVTVGYRRYKDVKARAVSCHASQLEFGAQSGPIVRVIRGSILPAQDKFMQARPPLDPKTRKKDLFARG